MKGYLQWNMFYKRVILWKQGLKQRQNKELKTVECVQVFWARLACFGQLGLISDPQIFSKLKNVISDPKGLENKIYIMMKDRETFYGDHTSQSSAVVKFYMFFRTVIRLRLRRFRLEQDSNSVH